MLRSYAVEQIVREKIYPELESYSLRLRLSLRLLIIFVLLSGFTVINLSVRAVAQNMPTPPNPFTAYADVFPGQPESVIEAMAYSCFTDASHYDHDPIEQRCVLSPAIGTFSDVEVIISEGIIRQITFTLRDNTLQAGNLEIFLEMPAIHVFDHVAHFILPKSFVMTQTSNYAGRFSYFLPVWSVSFTRVGAA
jgi:hypothetical protein